jgi:ribonuclease VapC
MIVDSSVLIAILKNEPEAQLFSNAMQEAKVVRISTATYLEACIVVERYENPVLTARLEEILENPGMVVEPISLEQARIARAAYRDYGRGSGHAANLNFGDCLSYALARTLREPLLFKGSDFLQTDLRSAVPQP